MTITKQKIVERNELQITLIKTFEFTSYVMGYDVYKDRWTPVKGEMLKGVVEPKNKEDKFCCCNHENVVIMLDIYQNIKLQDSFHFLQACDTNSCSLEITGKTINQGDRK